ncbi:secreted antigen 1 [Babesia divergens]|uniref:Secreted antigen 1 n=1 Tax=Babesia divergens TaxID=32595 RepID=A0AAD9GBH2_BABDI|nr:secreted antigen 1 [Babesia divergens]
MTDCNFQDPKNLKDILELLDKLYNASSLKDSVGQKLVQDVQKYFKDAEKFYGSRSGFLSDVFTKSSFIRITILDRSGTYDKYNDLTDRSHTGHEDCVKKISEALKKFLPRGYAALYYLYFMCSKTDFSGMHGGQWSNNNVKASGQKLYQWLTDNRLVTPELIERGFVDRELDTSNDGSTVASTISQIIKHDTPGPLQSALSHLLLACPWHDSLLGHACLFLSTFCDQVKDHGEKFQNYFSSSDFEELQRVCSTVKENLQPFTHASGLPLSAVCHSNSDLYSGLWNPEAIPLYVKWLKENLDSIIESLTLMSGECTKWDSENLQTAKTAGPFLYGFVFKGSWSDGTFKSQLPSKISSLTNSGPGSLQSLQKSLEKFSTGNPAATAGGVVTGLLGTGGLGAGAAYGLNLFGFKNLVTGLISGLLK